MEGDDIEQPVHRHDSPTPIFSMNGDMPHVPITTLAGIASLTDCKYYTATRIFTDMVDSWKASERCWWGQAIFDVPRRLTFIPAASFLY